MPRKHRDMEPGERVGHWVLLRKERNHALAHSPWRWRARCDCGNEKLIAEQHLRDGASTSCGCAPRGPRHHVRRFANVAVMKTFLGYKTKAAERGLLWALEERIFEAIINYPCSYCGAPPSNRTHYRGEVLQYTGIDRIDNSLGYVPGNVIPCCIQCNQAKSDYSLKEFVNWAARVVSRTAKLKIEEPA